MEIESWISDVRGRRSGRVLLRDLYREYVLGGGELTMHGLAAALRGAGLEQVRLTAGTAFVLGGKNTGNPGGDGSNPGGDGK